MKKFSFTFTFKPEGVYKAVALRKLEQLPFYEIVDFRLPQMGDKYLSVTGDVIPCGHTWLWGEEDVGPRLILRSKLAMPEPFALTVADVYGVKFTDTLPNLGDSAYTYRLDENNKVVFRIPQTGEYYILPTYLSIATVYPTLGTKMPRLIVVRKD